MAMDNNGHINDSIVPNAGQAMNVPQQSKNIIEDERKIPTDIMPLETWSNVMSYLPKEDALNMRAVHPEFEREAFHVVAQDKSKIFYLPQITDLATHDEIKNFLVNGENKNAPLKISVPFMDHGMDQLLKDHGKSIRFLLLNTSNMNDECLKIVAEGVYPMLESIQFNYNAPITKEGYYSFLENIFKHKENFPRAC